MKSARPITRGLSAGDPDMHLGSGCQKRASDLAAVSKKGRGSDRRASEVVSGTIEVSSRTEYHPRYAVYLACCINVFLYSIWKG